MNERRSGKPHSPIVGDDVFGKPSQKRNYSPLFGLSANDPNDFWSNTEERHAQHKQQLTYLVVAVAILMVLAFIIHINLLVFAAFIALFIPVEVVMVRRTRPTGDPE